MSWIRRKISRVTNSSPSSTAQTPRSQDPSIVRYDVFKSHWHQVFDIISTKSPNSPVLVKTNETTFNHPLVVTQDDVDAVRNLLEQMIYLLVEEQTSGLQLGPILEYVVTEGILDQLYLWCEKSGEFREQISMNQIKVYEVLISQAQHSLLHHRQLVNPMLKLLSLCSNMNSEEVDGHVVLLLNLLCVWINRDPTLLDIFFRLSDDQGPANFLIFSLLIDFIHREGSVGQQARDALLLCMTLSSEEERVALYIVSTNFCPVLATGLSGLYSSLPRQMDVRADEWHFLRKEDWSHVPSLVNFMNSLEFCNSVVEASGQIVSENLLNYIYNGFLVSVFGPALHKSSANEVVVTTAYLNLFLQSVTAPALMRCFLRFLLCHRHDNSLIVNTLIQRIGSNSRLALVSLSLFRTLIDLNCEDLMLHLVFRYLIPCHHILASQRRSMCDTDMYSASALRFIALSPDCCVQMKPMTETGIFGDKDAKDLSIFRPVQEMTKAEDSKSSPADVESNQNVMSERTRSSTNSSKENSYVSSEQVPSVITSPNTMAEFGPDLQSQVALHTSYMDYLEDAKSTIDLCREACSGWSEPYDGERPPMDSVLDATNSLFIKNDVHNSAPSLARNLDPEFDVYKPHTQSDPNPQAPDLRQHHLSSPALRALNATYQALNITAQALSNNSLSNVGSDESPKVNGSIEEKVSDNSDTASSTNKVNTSDKTEQVPLQTISNAEDFVADCTGKTLVNKKETKFHLNLSEVKETEPNHNAEQKIVTEHEPMKSAAMSPIQSASSVDEFFRTLMESVPMNAREKIEKTLQTRTEDSTESKNKTIASLADEDIESGIEVSSNGDPLLTAEDNEEQDANHANKTQSDTSDDVDGLEHEHFEDSSLNRSLDEEDWDENGDDTTSINSSSFYEPELEYIPTDQSLTPLTPLKLHSAPYTGPFLSTLFGKLDQMLSNSLYENLLLTGIISRLACYPQPLLRSFLLNTRMVFHPAVRSLYQVLTGVRNRIDSYSAGVNDFVVLVYRAQKYLLSRGTSRFGQENGEKDMIQDSPMPVPRVKTKNTILGEVFLRRKKRTRISKLGAFLEHGTKKSSMGKTSERQNNSGLSRFYTSPKDKNTSGLDKSEQNLRTKNAVYAAVVLHEFLKELAAVSQEHAVAG